MSIAEMTATQAIGRPTAALARPAVCESRSGSSFELDLTGFRAISLGDLDATVALQRRRDHKYLVEHALGREVIAELVDRGDRSVLEIDGRRTFRYESLYFDTDDLALYRAAVQQRRRRAKVRIRRYVDTGDRFLEVKLKDGRGMQQKHRMSIAGSATRLDVDMRRFVDSLIGEVGLARRLRPTSVTSYRRTTLVHANSSTRATFDTDLVVFDVRDRSSGVPAPSAGLSAMIVESKSANGAADLDRLLWERGVRPAKVSKYCTGLAAIDRGLASNRWHRTLGGYFATDAD